jgi:mannitol operon repressor
MEEQIPKSNSWLVVRAYTSSFPDKADIPACPICNTTKFIAALVDEQEGTTECTCCENGHAWFPNELVRIPIIQALREEEYPSTATGHALDIWMNQFWTEIEGSSDRVFVILSGAMVDEMLSILLTTLSIDHKLIQERLLNPNRPLGSLGARIDACYLFGLISKDEWQALRVLQKTRNDFAHKLDNLSFKDTSIKKNIHLFLEAIHMPEQNQNDNGRMLFQAGVIKLWGSLVTKIHLTNRAGKMPSDPSIAMSLHYSTRYQNKKS